ncbi:MAG TPA: alpha/beta hydrolase [Phycisphaerae bacterium]|nr:alpha/beta hydrolase [Phycisphaerae bacterium]
MATFVLVHGAWAGGAAWAEVADGLRARGHRVFAPTLTGIGERRHLLSGTINLSTHVQDIVGLIDSEGLSDVILAGHSYGGMVVTGVADRVPHRIRKLAYVDAIVPENGQSMLDVFGPERAVRIMADAAANGGTAIPCPSPSYFRLPPELAAQAGYAGTFQPLATFVERLRLRNGPWAGPRAYIVAGTYAGSIFLTRFWPRFSADPSWQCFEIPCSHTSQVEAPERLTEVLAELA